MAMYFVTWILQVKQAYGTYKQGFPNSTGHYLNQVEFPRAVPTSNYHYHLAMFK